jgi:hypothetical protein
MVNTKKNKIFIKNTKKNKTISKKDNEFEKTNCSPSKNMKSYSCYSNNSIYKLKKYWNIRHPDNLILTNDTKDIWSQLKAKMSDVCDKESCWLKQKFIKNNLDSELRNYTFAPKMPNEWKKNPYEWLSSTDIEKVMKQYEYAYPTYTFLGPSPIDFDKKKLYGQCVWEELCNFDLKSYIKKNKTKIGIIFNTDPHYKGGSHWIALFIDIKKKFIYYFDSNGDECPKEIKLLVDRIIEQASQMNIDMTFNQNHPKEHQEGDTECGVYTLYFITELLKENKTYEYFNKHKITDEAVHIYRKVYFNE